MILVRMLVVLGISATFGILCGVCCAKWHNAQKAEGGIWAAFLGTAGALLLQSQYPILFNQLGTFEAWFNWLPLVFSKYVIVILPSSAILLPAGFAVGFGLTMLLRHRRSEKILRQAFTPLLVCLVGFYSTWVIAAEHLPRGVRSTIYVYRVYEPSKSWSEEQSNTWVSFIEWNFGPGFGYESFDPEYVRKDAERFDHAEAPAENEMEFIFVKELRKDGKRIAATHRVLKGCRTYRELVTKLRSMAITPLEP